MQFKVELGGRPMKQARDRLRVPSPTVLQMMKLVVLGGVASACLAFGARLSDEGVGRGTPALIPIMEALGLPLALALVAFPLLRKGQFKDWFILVMVAISLSVTLGLGILGAVVAIRVRSSMRPPPPLDYSVVGGVSVTLAGLGLGLYYISRRIVPVRCPDCRRFGLLPERGRFYRCFRCENAFRELRGLWEAIPGDPSPPEHRPPAGPGIPDTD
jgi:hypothetical protein